LTMTEYDQTAVATPRTTLIAKVALALICESPDSTLSSLELLFVIDLVLKVAITFEVNVALIGEIIEFHDL